MGSGNEPPAHFPLGLDLNHITPIPPDPDQTRYFAVGDLQIGLENRNLDLPSAEGQFVDSGPSIHVEDRSTGIEYLRFDMFDAEPHYHYMKTGTSNRLVVFDHAANGDMASWTLRCLRYRLPEMLIEAGAEHLSANLDIEALSKALNEIASALECAVDQQ
jgi:hypothetical protein